MNPLEPLFEALRARRIAIHGGAYPRDILQGLGQEGYFESFLKKQQQGLLDATLSIANIAQICGNTGFCIWCQQVLLWYLLHSQQDQSEAFLKASYGEILGGTGLSNPVKSFANIEKIKLKASRVDGGYYINGSLPWVSNLDYGHYFGMIAKLSSTKPSQPQEFVAGLVVCQEPLLIKQISKFIAFEGSLTQSVFFKDYFLSDKQVLGYPLSHFFPKVLPGFLILQLGMALGMIRQAFDLISSVKLAKNGINAFLPKPLDDFLKKEESFYAHIKELAHSHTTNQTTNKDYLHAILSLKQEMVNTLLELSQLCLLAHGTKGYFHNSIVAKFFTEAQFLALITPSLKHIQKILQKH